MRITTIILSLVLCLSLSERVGADDRIDAFREYIDLLVSSNFESAGQLWLESTHERASRFGIEFDDIPLKIDCGSPIVRNLTVMRNHLSSPVSRISVLNPDDYVRLDFSELVDGKLVEHSQYIYYDSAYHWLIFPQDYYCRNWQVEASKYLRIHVHPDVQKFLNSSVISQADQFVETTARRLGIDDETITLISQKKIEYYYCENDSRIEMISGHLVKGFQDLGSNDVISAFFPHFHEIVHLLVNIKLHRIPLYTLPILREGIAVHLGGRWGKAPEVLNSLGVFILDNSIVELDSILTMIGFETNGGADIGYPIASLFTAYLIDQYGYERFWDIYRDLSGDFVSLNKLTTTEIQNRISKVCGTTWTEFHRGFTVWTHEADPSGSLFLPGGISGGTEILSQDGFQMATNDEWITLEFTAIDDQLPTGNILLGADQSLSGTRSYLFEEQYSGRYEFEGYRYGIRFDANEAGLYDYASNHLIAKYIYGLSPSNDYLDSEKKLIRVKFRKRLVGDALENLERVKRLPL